MKGLPYLKSFEYVSPDKAADDDVEVRARDAIKTLPQNPLPPAFYVKLTDANKASTTAAAAQKISAMHNCGSPPCVTYGKKITDRVLNTLQVHPVLRVRADDPAGDRGRRADPEHDPALDLLASA